MSDTVQEFDSEQLETAAQRLEADCAKAARDSTRLTFVNRLMRENVT